MAIHAHCPVCVLECMTYEFIELILWLFVHDFGAGINNLSFLVRPL